MMGEDPHADQRDREREKRTRGHRESGRSVKLIQQIIVKRATGELPPTSKKRRRV